MSSWVESWLVRQEQVWVTSSRVFAWRDLIAIELHHRFALGFSLWRWYVALFVGPLVVVVGRRPLAPLQRMTDDEVHVLQMFRDLEWSLAAPPPAPKPETRDEGGTP